MHLSPYGDRTPTRDEAIQQAGATLARVLAAADAKSPRQAAEDAHCRGGPSVDELERLIRAERGLPPRDQPTVHGPDAPSVARTRPRRRSEPRPDALAAVAGLSREEKLALADALRSECG